MMVTEIEIVIHDSVLVNFYPTITIIKNHASLENLDYAHSGHTGFASSADLAAKQDALTAGTNITIQNNVISASGGSSGPSIGVVTVTSTTGTMTSEQMDTIRNSDICFVKYDTSIYLVSEKTNTTAYFARSIPKTTGSSGTYWVTTGYVTFSNGYFAVAGNMTSSGTYDSAVVIETGALVKKLYSDLSPYKLVFCYGYRDALNAPNQFMFAFMPDQLQVDGEDLQFYAIAGSSNWEYPIKVKRSSDGYVYWWSAYDYGGNTTFYVTKIVGVK